MIHGFRGAPAGLASIADELTAAGYDVYVPSIPPFGGAGPLSEYTPDTYAKFLKDFAAEHHLSRPVLIGHSMGSLVATSAVDRYPDVFSDTLILLSPISKVLPWYIRSVTPLQSIIPSRIIDRISTSYLIIDKTKKQEIRELTSLCSKASTSSSREAVRAAKFSYGHAISDFSLPPHTHIIVGEKDHLVKIRDTEQLSGIESIAIIPQSGHLHNYEAPKATAELIVKCLKG